MLTTQEVQHIAKLARIHLTDDEVEKFQKDLSGILDFVDKLRECNTDGVAETSQITGLENIKRPDTIEACDYESQLLESSPNPIVDHSIQIDRIM